MQRIRLLKYRVNVCNIETGTAVTKNNKTPGNFPILVKDKRNKL